MIMSFTSPVYFLIIAVCAAICSALWFLLKNKSERTKNILLFVLALLNVLQHLLKHVIYPHLRGQGFGLTNTAYNVCAILILLTPAALLAKKGVGQQFISFVGVFGGAGAILLPVWFVGETVFQWEYLRYFICHLLLLLTSLLPILWGMRKPDWRDFWKAVPLFFVLLCAILLNDIIVLCVQRDFTPETLYARLYELNPFGMMHPMGHFNWLDRLLVALTPSCFLPTEAHPYYTPVLWCAIPLAIGVALIALVIFCSFDRKAFISDCKSFLTRIKSRIKK